VPGILATLIDVEHLVKVAGYPLLVVIVMGESSGVPLPGETALITAAVLASSGKLKIELVIPLAAASAIVGDNLGYLFARKGGRWLLERPGRFQRQRNEILVIGEPFFARHGPKAVFFGRFILGLRTWAAWLAGATRMHWRSFLVWNALGGICWATIVGLIAYYLGQSAKNALETFGVYGLIAALFAIVSAFFLGRRYRGGADSRRARTAQTRDETQTPDEPQTPGGGPPAPS
jgi:membrane protein DedA with SNARE-associated domain